MTVTGQKHIRRRYITVEILMFAVDLALILYWVATAAHLIPTELAFKDYQEPVIVAWNWSFSPLDVSASIIGIIAVLRLRTGKYSPVLLSVSLALTFCAGLMAISFWTLYRDFDLIWWIPNILLMIIPIACAFLLYPISRSANESNKSTDKLGKERASGLA